MQNDKINKAHDKMISAGKSVISKKVLMMNDIKEALKKKELRDELMEYIFGGNPKAVSPLKEIRDNYK